MPLERGAAEVSATAPPVTGKRVNFILSERAYADLGKLATDTKRSMTEIVRLGIGLARLALEAERKGHRLIVTNSEGDPIKEIVLPG